MIMSSFSFILFSFGWPIKKFIIFVFALFGMIFTRFAHGECFYKLGARWLVVLHVIACFAFTTPSGLQSLYHYTHIQTYQNIFLFIVTIVIFIIFIYLHYIILFMFVHDMYTCMTMFCHMFLHKYSNINYKKV